MYQEFVIPAVAPESRPLNRSCYPYDKLDSLFTARSARCPGMTRKRFTSGRHPETQRAAVSGPGKKGFTLIELLVVVLIIGILASVVLPQYQKAVEKSRLTEALQLMQYIENSMQVQFLSCGEDCMADFDSYLELPFEIDAVQFSTPYFDFDLDNQIVVDRKNHAYSFGFAADNFSDLVNKTGTYGGKFCEGYTDVGMYICKFLENNGYTVEDKR